MRASRPLRRLGSGLAFAVLSGLASSAAAQDLTLDGQLPVDGPRHVYVELEVPPGTVELEVRHDDLSDENILDWGLYAPDGTFRGYGGGNEEPAVLNADAASRSYVPGPIPAGTWRVHIGLAKVAVPPAQYRIEAFFRTTATLAPQPERQPYVEPSPLKDEPGWYAGDFHVHSRESGDAGPTLDEIAIYARGRGLDFVALSDHNTLTGHDFITDVQSRHPELLFVPSLEWTSYGGHGNVLGVTRLVDHKIGLGGATFEGALEAIAAQDALFIVNHPALDVGDLCIGCAWTYGLDDPRIEAVEIATGGWRPAGFIFTPKVIERWDAACATGRHIAAVGGSDDHQAGTDDAPQSSPIGNPTTVVYASALSPAAIREGVRNGRTVVKLQGPDDPMVVLAPANLALEGDTVTGGRVEVTARVEGQPSADGAMELRFVVDGEVAQRQAVETLPVEATLVTTPPTGGQLRVRAELWVDGDPRVVTSHLWVADGPGGDLAPTTDAGCGCRVVPGASPLSAGWVGILLGLLCLRRREPPR